MNARHALTVVMVLAALTTGRAPAGETETDTRIAETFKNTYVYEEYLKDDASVTAQVKVSLMSHRSTSVRRTKVTTENGVVTLSGTAMNEAEKALVAKLATDIAGVKQVVNNMTIEKTAGD